MEFRLNFPWLKRFLLVFCIFLISSNSYAQAGSLYRKAVDSVKAGSLAHAFMYFKILAEEYPRSPLYSRALFAIGEYYFSISDYSRALDSFSEFIESCPDDKAVSFALAYMLNIAQKRGTKPLVESIKGKIVSSVQRDKILFTFQKAL